MMEFGLTQQRQTLALMLHLPLIEVWIMSTEGELGWIKEYSTWHFHKQSFSNLSFWPLLSPNLMEYIVDESVGTSLIR